MRAFIVVLFLPLLSGCLLYKTSSGYSLFKPAYMSRDRTVTADDVKIVKRAIDIFTDLQYWNRNDDRFCFCEEAWSLFCALAKSSIDVTGEYQHRRVAIQEIRFTINDHFRERWQYHQLQDFNNNPATSIEDVIWILTETHTRLQKRYQQTQQSHKK